MKKLKILSQIFEIVEVDYLYNEFGFIDFEHNKIVIKKGLDPKRKNITLLHEILHAILQQLGFEKENDNEQLINSLSTALYDIFSVNNELFF